MTSLRYEVSVTAKKALVELTCATTSRAGLEAISSKSIRRALCCRSEKSTSLLAVAWEMAYKDLGLPRELMNDMKMEFFS